MANAFFILISNEDYDKIVIWINYYWEKMKEILENRIK